MNGQVYGPEWDWEAAHESAGATPAHNRVASNVAFMIMSQLRERGCDVLFSDQRISVGKDKYAYPDLVVSCNPSHDDMPLTNPQLIIEYSRPQRRSEISPISCTQYLLISSLEEYWVIQVNKVGVSRYYRHAGGWTIESFSELAQTIRSGSLSVEVPLSAIYRPS